MKTDGVSVNTTFASTYTCEPLTEVPNGTSTRYYYPGASSDGGRDGLIVRVRAGDTSPWLGVFAFGMSRISAIFAAPDPNRFCVVANGAGYLVDARAPSTWEEIRAFPITDVRAVASAELLVFADHTNLVAYDASGFAWRTKRLVLDGLEITKVTSMRILGTGDQVGGPPVDFSVDLLTGSHEGGFVDPCF